MSNLAEAYNKLYQQELESLENHENLVDNKESDG